MRIKHRLSRVTRTPAFGVAILTPIVLAGGGAPRGGGAPPPPPAPPPAGRGGPAQVVAAEVNRPDFQGTTVVPALKPPTDFRFGANAISPPPPAAVVNAVGGMRIPATALAAYRNAEKIMSSAAPNCGVSWNLLAGIGRIESSHANGGATDASGTALRPIYGPVLDGSLPGNEVIVQGNTGGRPVYARAIGPMQFLPGTWSRFASDGDGDGKADPQNIYDAALSTARYLCSGGLNLRNQAQVLTAILRYNNSMAYAENVLGWAAAYATGVAPLDLPAITGPVPALGDAHMNNPQGLGPGMPGVGPGDPLAQLTGLGDSQMAGQMILPGPGADSVLPQHGCEVICMASQVAPTADNLPPWMPPWMSQSAPQPWMAPSPDAIPGMPAVTGQLPGPAPAGQLPGPAPVGQLPGPAPVGQLPGPAPVGQLPGPAPVAEPVAPVFPAPAPGPEPVGSAEAPIAPEGPGPLPGPAA